MTSKLLASLAAGAALSIGAAIATPVNYTLPEETASFKPGPNLDVVQSNCTGCHSADSSRPSRRARSSRKTSGRPR